MIFTLAGGILSMAKLEAVDKEKKDGALGEVCPRSNGHPKLEEELGPGKYL